MCARVPASLYYAGTSAGQPAYAKGYGRTGRVQPLLGAAPKRKTRCGDWLSQRAGSLEGFAPAGS